MLIENFSQKRQGPRKSFHLKIINKNTLVTFLGIQEESLFSARGVDRRNKISNDNLNPKAIMCECQVPNQFIQYINLKELI